MPVEPNSPEAQRLPVDTTVITQTLIRARAVLANSHPLPRPYEVAYLTGHLCGHIRLLLEEVKPVVDVMDHGTTGWDRMKTTYDGARSVLDSETTHGLTAATVRLHELTRQCGFLLDIVTSPQAVGDPR
ncbi:DUF6415 family natural product biosynthesis protein [Streptomyces sp. NPDC053720]|uniref:DUF6415 family natural product biosynthesis protein n=1 Tax=Streptomyces sp. NPDC053720 TaxID=3154855 RepID=UPI00343BC645